MVKVAFCVEPNMMPLRPFCMIMVSGILWSKEGRITEKHRPKYSNYFVKKHEIIMQIVFLLNLKRVLRQLDVSDDG